MPIIITSKKDGFRRAGHMHGRTPTTWPDDAFTAAELDQIKADPMLTVGITKPTAATAKGGKSSSGAGRPNQSPRADNTPTPKPPATSKPKATKP